MQRDVDAGSEVADHLFAIEGNEAGAAVGEVVGEKAAADAEGVAGPGDVDIDFLDADFEDVAGLGFFDGDGAGEDVATGTFFGGGDFGVDVVDVRGDVGGGDAERFEAGAGAAGGEGLDGDGVAGLDGENGFRACGVIAPGYRRGSGEEGLRGLLGGLLGGGCGDGEESSGAESGCAGEDGGHEVLYITVVHARRETGDGMRDYWLGVVCAACSLAAFAREEFFESDFESERRQYVCAWALFVCAVAADSLYRDRRNWDERDRGDPADDGVYGFGQRFEAQRCDGSLAGDGGADL